MQLFNIHQFGRMPSSVEIDPKSLRVNQIRKQLMPPFLAGPRLKTGDVTHGITAAPAPQSPTYLHVHHLNAGQAQYTIGSWLRDFHFGE